MASIIVQSMLANFPSRVFNIFLSPNGDGSLLSQTDGALSSTQPNAEFTIFSLLAFFTHLKRYYLGHVAGRLLILEIAHAGAVQKEECGNVKQSPIFRNIMNAIPAMYRAQTWENTFYSLTLSLLYYIVHYLVTTCLEMFIFRHAALQPLAYAISSVLLCDIHFLKTGTATSTQLPLLPLMTTEDPNRFRNLAGPAFALGMSKALIKRVESMVKYILISHHEQTPTSIGMRAGTDVLIVMIVIVFRVVGILPGTIILTLTEASLLPPT
ncbi:hypothetical protein N7467_003859 [Penicillium canescens]|nr:hypothetical protein N7467_003859 [Penicillium canescens]